MKTKLLLSAVLMMCVLAAFSFSFKNPDRVKATVSKGKTTSVEFGEFNQCGIIYAVYGDASTGNVTAVKFYGGGDVYSFTSGAPAYYSAGAWHVNLTVNPLGYTSFNFSGEILYY